MRVRLSASGSAIAWPTSPTRHCRWPNIVVLLLHSGGGRRPQLFFMGKAEQRRSRCPPPHALVGLLSCCAGCRLNRCLWPGNRPASIACRGVSLGVKEPRAGVPGPIAAADRPLPWRACQTFSLCPPQRRRQAPQQGLHHNVGQSFSALSGFDDAAARRYRPPTLAKNSFRCCLAPVGERRVLLAQTVPCLEHATELCPVIAPLPPRSAPRWDRPSARTVVSQVRVGPVRRVPKSAPTEAAASSLVVASDFLGGSGRPLRSPALRPIRLRMDALVCLEPATGAAPASPGAPWSLRVAGGQLGDA